MKIPFSQDAFFRIFESYNEAIWPLQLLFYALAAGVVYVIAKKADPEKIVFSMLAFLWIWMGLVYHLIFFAAINEAAWIFGFLFIAQGVIFLFFGVWHEKVPLKFEPDLAGIAGIIFILYALVIYPVLGTLIGHGYPRSPTFGVPCPTTIFTFGVLMFAQYRVPWYLVIIPLLWSLIGFSAAVSLAVWEDLGLVVAGVVSGVMVLFIKPKKEAERSIVM